MGMSVKDHVQSYYKTMYEFKFYSKKEQEGVNKML